MSDAGHPCEVISEVFTLVERRGARDRLQPAAFLESLHQHGQMGRVAVTHDLDAGTAGTDVIYTDGWPRSTREPAPERDALMTIQIAQTTLDRAGAATLLMHFIPVRRGDEVTAAAFDDHRSITLKAKANLGPTHTATISHVLDQGRRGAPDDGRR